MCSEYVRSMLGKGWDHFGNCWKMFGKCWDTFESCWEIVVNVGTMLGKVLMCLNMFRTCWIVFFMLGKCWEMVGNTHMYIMLGKV